MAATTAGELRHGSVSGTLGFPLRARAADVAVIRLLDDTKCYLHAVIDNFSRRILAWRLARRLDPITTCLLYTSDAADDLVSV